MKKALKKIVLIMFALSLVLTLGFTSVYAEEQIIKVGYLENYGILNEPIIAGAEGLGFEYLSEIEKHTNYKFEYISTNWKDGFELLQKGEIDLFGLAAMTDERREFCDYIRVPVCYEIATLYAKENADLYYSNPKSLDGFTVGITGPYSKAIENYANKNGIYLKIENIADDFSKYLENGKIDLFLAGSLSEYEGTKIVDELYSTPVYFVAAKGNTTLRENMENAMAKIQTENPYFDENLWNKYYSNNNMAKKRITQNERIALDEKDSYSVGYHADLHPISYIGEDGLPKGYAVDIMNLLAEKLDIKLNYIALHAENSPSIENIDFNLCVLDDKSHSKGTFSVPYYYHDLMLIREKGLSPQEVKNIGALNYANIDMENYLAQYPSAKLYKVYSSAESAELVKTVDIDCFAALEGRAEMILANVGFEEYYVDFLGVEIPMTISMSDTLSNGIITAMNKEILGLSKSEVEELIIENVSLLKSEPTLVDILAKYIWRTIIFVALTVFGLAYAYIRIIKKNQKHLRNLLEVDSLTGLMSGMKFMSDVSEVLKTAKPNEYFLISFDVDDFKSINHLYGFNKGNDFLRAIANSMRKYMSKDILMCHYSNDVFLMFGKTEIISGEKVLEKEFSQELCDKIVASSGVDFPLHLSVGVYYIEDPTISMEIATDYLRKARMIAKEKHGNTITIYSDDIKKKTDKEREIITSMEQAIKDKEFFIVIQPKIELQTGKLVGGEVLVRWKRASGAFVYPDEFIPLFEKNQFITILDMYVFEEACRFVKNSSIQLPCLSVNTSAVTALSENCLESYLEILERYQLKPEQFELELTESALNDDFENIISIGRKLRKAGFYLSIDDFGVGASSLSRIKELHVNVIKLDKSFLSDHSGEEKGRIVIENIVVMANSLGFLTLAEGVETQEDLDILIDLGCDLGQGYFFDKPLAVEDFFNRVVEDMQKEYPDVTKTNEKIKRYLTNFQNLPYGIAITKNDPYSTIVTANIAFYNLIGHTKKELWKLHQNRLTEILIDNRYNVVEPITNDEDYNLEFDLRLRTVDGKIVWVHDYLHYDAAQDLFFITFVDMNKQIILSGHNLDIVDSQKTDEKKALQSASQNVEQKMVVEKEKICIEEISELNLLEKCRKNLQSLEHHELKIKDVLDTLRVHYGAYTAAIMAVSEDRKTFGAAYESLSDNSAISLMETYQNRPIQLLVGLANKFEKQLGIAISDREKIELPLDEREIWEKYDIKNVMSSPMYSQKGELIGLISVTNITLNKRSKAIIHVVSKYISDYIERVRYHHISMLDSLTGLLNKSSTKHEIEVRLEQGVAGVMFMIDLDYFKNVNDTLGHSTGDKVLEQLACDMKNTFRSTDVLGRVGGDEFMVFCQGTATDKMIQEKAQAILNASNREYQKDGLVFKTSVSIGICRTLGDGYSFKELYEKADKALYTAKKNGKNQYYFEK